MKKEYKHLSQWSISPEIVDFLVEALSKDNTIIEFGSGTGSIELEKHFHLWSIEHNPTFLYQNTLTNIYAPMKKYQKINPTIETDMIEYEWYDQEVVRNVMKKINYDCILVDGPPGIIGRDGFLHNINKFDTNCLIVIDDVNRDDENKLLFNVSKKLNCSYSVFHCKDNKSYGVIDNR